MKKFISLIVIAFFIALSSFSSEGSAEEQGTTIYWSEEKSAVYRPLFSYTLPWYDDVMKHGGFDVDTGTIVTDGTKADVVMNTYSHAGARKITKLNSFGKPLHKDSVKFETDGLGYILTSKTMAQGDIFLIEASDGKFVQIRIDRIVLPSEVHFTYVVEEDVPAKEDLTEFTPLKEKYTRDDKKVWTVQFNQPVDEKTVNSNTIYVKDSKGYLIKTELRLAEQDHKKVYIYPSGPYQDGENYTVYVTKEVKSTKAKPMKKGTVMPFTLDLNGKYPDKTEPQPLYGLSAAKNGDKVRLSWYSSSANDLAGYRVYYRIDGKDSFAKLLKSNKEDLYYSAEADVFEIEGMRGKKVEFYVTAVDKSGNESIPSNFITYTFESSGDPSPNPDPKYESYFGQWTLETSLASFGKLTISENGTYTWTGGPNGSSSGKWEVRKYGFVLVKADGGDDYIIERSDRNLAGIKLLTVTDGKYTDGSPIMLYLCDGK